MAIVCENATLRAYFVKEAAQRIFRNTLGAIDIPRALVKSLARSGPKIRAESTVIDLRDYREIVAIAFGKAAFAMARSLNEILAPDYQPEGFLVIPSKIPEKLRGWKTFVGGHPVPNEESFMAGRAIVDRLAASDEHTLIVFLISGGGSSLVERSLYPQLGLSDFQALHLALVTCGGTIEEINVVRKHLSATKGGRLAAVAPRSVKLTFAISDVPPGEESALASGPTLPDDSTVGDAERITRKYGLLDRLSPRMRVLFETKALIETPKRNAPAFLNSHFVEILGGRDLLHAAHRACETEGYISLCDTVTDGWPIARAVRHLLDLLGAHKRASSGRAVALVVGGEVSSAVTGAGMGGRNSSFVLACVSLIAGEPITVLSGGTDGIDGNSPGAGAVADGFTLPRAQSYGLNPEEFFNRSDAYNFFARLDDTITIGPTGNNLRDLRILLTP